MKNEHDTEQKINQDILQTQELKRIRRERRASVRRRRLWVSLAVIAAAVILRAAAPQDVDSFRQRAVQAVCGSVDFGAAAEALGRGLSGETEFSRALEEACTYAFSPDWGGTVAAGGNGG